jgi:hypothetical protein
MMGLDDTMGKGAHAVAYFLRREESRGAAEGAVQRGRSLDGYAYAGQCIRCHAMDVTMAWDAEEAEAMMALDGDDLIIAIEEALGGLVELQQTPDARDWPAACRHVRNEGAMPYVRVLPGLCALAALGDYDADPTPADVLAAVGGTWPAYANGDWLAVYEGEELDQADPAEGWALFRPVRVVWVLTEAEANAMVAAEADA